MSDEFENKQALVRLWKIHDLLSTPLVSSILQLHPNDFFQSGASKNTVPKEWNGWWDQWAAKPARALRLIRFLNFKDAIAKSSGDITDDDIPQELKQLLDDVRSLQLERSPLPFSTPEESKSDREWPTYHILNHVFNINRNN